MQMKKLITKFIVSLTLLTMLSSTAIAESETSKVEDSLERVTLSELKTFNDMSVIERDSNIVSIANAVVGRDVTKIRELASLFTSECFLSISRYVSGNRLGKGMITDAVIDNIHYSNSSNSDTTIMCNIKVNHGEFNNLLLFEFHVDNDGCIYGYNVWSY